jgi:CheY-like chemotaxis protein
LGLSISRSLVTLMGGELMVESTPGLGSTFSIELRLGIAATVPVEAPTVRRSGADLAGARILVAEDQPINQRVIGDMLHLLGARVTLANHGREALKRLAEAPFDAVLMDIQMPELDGLAATERIRENPAWVNLPVIALTAGVTEAEQERMRACGMSDLLPKPITLNALSAILERWIEPAPMAQPAPVIPPPSNAFDASGADPGERLALPAIDIPTLRKMVGETTDVRALLRQFADEIRDDAQTIVRSLDRGDAAEADRLVHRLKGTAGNFRAMDLYAAATRLETDLQAGQDPGPALDAMRQAHAQALAQIAGLPPPAAPAGGAHLPSDAAAVCHLVGQIQDRLATGLLVPPDTLAVLEAALPVHEQALYQDLKRHLGQFDYRAATTVLDLLLSVHRQTQVKRHDE